MAQLEASGVDVMKKMIIMKNYRQTFEKDKWKKDGSKMEERPTTNYLTFDKTFK